MKAQKIVLLILSTVLIPTVASVMAEEAKVVDDSVCCQVGSFCQIVLRSDCEDMAGTPYDHPPYNCVQGGSSFCKKAEVDTVPSLSEWGVTIFAFSLLISGAVMIWRRIRLQHG